MRRVSITENSVPMPENAERRQFRFGKGYEQSLMASRDTYPSLRRLLVRDKDTNLYFLVDIAAYVYIFPLTLIRSHRPPTSDEI